MLTDDVDAHGDRRARAQREFSRVGRPSHATPVDGLGVARAARRLATHHRLDGDRRALLGRRARLAEQLGELGDAIRWRILVTQRIEQHKADLIEHGDRWLAQEGLNLVDGGGVVLCARELLLDLACTALFFLFALFFLHCLDFV